MRVEMLSAEGCDLRVGEDDFKVEQDLKILTFAISSLGGMPSRSLTR